MAGRKITVEFLGEDKDLQKTLGNVEGSSSKLSGVLGKVGKAAAVGLAVGGAAAIAGGKHFFDLAATVEQMGQKADTVFGSQIGKVDKWAAANAHAMGLTRTQATGLAANFGDLLIPMGFTRKQAAGMSTDVVGLSGALSQWSGGTKSAAEVSEILSAAMLGETDGLKSLGIAISAADIEAALLAKGQDKLEGAARQQAEAQAIQALIMAKSTDAQDAFAKGGSPLLSAQAKLKAQFGEMQEMIATKLIPVFTSMSDWFLTTGVPALQSFGDMIAEKLGPPLEKIGGWIKDTLVPAVKDFVTQIQDGEGAGGKFRDVFEKVADALGKVAEFVSENEAAVGTFLGVIGTVIAVTKIWAGVQAALNLVMSANPLGAVVVLLAAVAGSLVYAYKKSETFRTVVDGAMEGVKTAFKAVGNAFEWVWKNLVQPVLNFIGDKIRGVIDIVAAMLAALGKAPGMGWATEAANKLRAAAEQGERLGKSIRDIPPGKTITINFLYPKGKPKAQFGDDPNDPLMQFAQRTTSTVAKGFLDGKMKQLLEPAGKSLITGLISGIEKKKKGLQAVLEKVTDHVAKVQEKLTALLDKRKSIVDSFKGFATSVFGADMGDAENPATAQTLVDHSAGQRGKAEQLNADVRKLIAMGLSRDMINELIASGQSGMDQIHLLAGATAEQIAAVNANNAATQAALTAAGLAAADAVMGEQIAAAQRDVALADGIRDKLQALLEQQDKNTVVQLILDGKTLHASLLKLKKAKNKKLELD